MDPEKIGIWDGIQPFLLECVQSAQYRVLTVVFNTFFHDFLCHDSCLKIKYWDKRKQCCGSDILDLGAFLTPGFRIWDPGWVKNRTTRIYFRKLRNNFLVKFFDADLGSEIRDGKIRTRDRGWKKFGSEIRDKHPGFATLKERHSLMLIFNLRIHVYVKYCLLYHSLFSLGASTGL
jgi:hypothetical protein